MTRTEYVNLLAWLRVAEADLSVRFALCQRGTYRTDCIKCAESNIVAQAFEIRSVRAKLSAWFHNSRVGVAPWVSFDVHSAVADSEYRYPCILQRCSKATLGLWMEWHEEETQPTKNPFVNSKEFNSNK